TCSGLVLGQAAGLLDRSRPRPATITPCLMRLRSRGDLAVADVQPRRVGPGESLPGVIAVPDVPDATGHPWPSDAVACSWCCRPQDVVAVGEGGNFAGYC